MAVSATFNIGGLSPYVGDAIEDPSGYCNQQNPSGYYSQQVPLDLRSNPSKEGGVDVGALANEAQGSPGDQQAKEDQDHGAIQALFSFTSPGLVLFWRPLLEDQTRVKGMSIFIGSKAFWIMHQAFCWRRPFCHLS